MGTVAIWFPSLLSSKYERCVSALCKINTAQLLYGSEEPAVGGGVMM